MKMHATLLDSRNNYWKRMHLVLLFTENFNLIIKSGREREVKKCSSTKLLFSYIIPRCGIMTIV